jgi:hypothetical protein
MVIIISMLNSIKCLPGVIMFGSVSGQQFIMFIFIMFKPDLYHVCTYQNLYHVRA